MKSDPPVPVALTLRAFHRQEQGVDPSDRCKYDGGDRRLHREAEQSIQTDDEREGQGQCREEGQASLPGPRRALMFRDGSSLSRRIAAHRLVRTRAAGHVVEHSPSGVAGEGLHDCPASRTCSSGRAPGRAEQRRLRRRRGRTSSGTARELRGRARHAVRRGTSALAVEARGRRRVAVSPGGAHPCARADVRGQRELAPTRGRLSLPPSARPRSRRGRARAAAPPRSRG